MFERTKKLGKKIKDKIWATGAWVKRNVKKVLITIGIIGIAMASGVTLEPEEIQNIDYVPSIDNVGYKAAEHNLDRVEFEAVRRKVDYRYREAHDVLSEAYYEGKEFVWKGENYGKLTKEDFKRYQNVIWEKYILLFNEVNEKLPITEKAENWNEIREEDGTLIDTKTNKAEQRINQLKDYEIEI